MRVTCPLVAGPRGRLVPSLALDAPEAWLNVEGDPASGRVTVSVETDDPAFVLACEGVELIEA